MGDVPCLVPRAASDRNQVDGQALIDQKPHPASIVASLRRVRLTGCRSCQGWRRGRPRSGYADA
jgi:hypothetical protein